MQLLGTEGTSRAQRWPQGHHSRERSQGKFKSIIRSGWGAQDRFWRGFVSEGHCQGCVGALGWTGGRKESWWQGWKMLAECMDSLSRRDMNKQGRMWKNPVLLLSVVACFGITNLFFLSSFADCVPDRKPFSVWSLRGFVQIFCSKNPFFSKHEPVIWCMISLWHFSLSLLICVCLPFKLHSRSPPVDSFLCLSLSSVGEQLVHGSQADPFYKCVPTCQPVCWLYTHAISLGRQLRRPWGIKNWSWAVLG